MLGSVPEGRYIPALGWRVLTRWYDAAIRALCDEETNKTRLVREAGVRSGHRVLDLGCGTGTLTIMLKRSCPDAIVAGLDGDPEALRIARRKAERAGADITWHEAMAWAPPLPPRSIDRVVSSLLFHHLTTEDKRRTLAAARALCAEGGELVVADWGKPHDPVMRAAFLAVQLLDGFATTGDSVRGALPALMFEAGFGAVAEIHRARTPLGTLSLYRALAL
jgi:ubiquinone/menaquinone biosynthesis C-methylase UbiE